MCFFARMSGILSSLNKSGQFMSDEKKKGGFWSWFGLGKNKQEASAEPKEQESKEQLPNESEVQGTAEKTTALSDEAETENTLTEDTSMAQTSTLVPEFHEAQSEITQSEEDEAHAMKRAPSVEQATTTPESHDVQAETSQEESPAAQAWTLAPSSEEGKESIESAVDIEDESVVETEEHEEESAVADMVETQEKPSEGGFFSRLLKGLVKTKQNIGAGFRSFFLGKKIDDELFEELEEQLLIADIGVPTTTKIINNLNWKWARS